MANALYDNARASFLGASPSINWSSDTIKVVLAKISGGYAVDLANDQFLSSVAGGNQISKTAALSSKTTTAGVANAGNTTFTAVTGAVSGALVIEKDTGTDATSPLIAYIDTATGLPVTPNGGDINVSWNTGSNKIFKL